jgi:hypothetical protein
MLEECLNSTGEHEAKILKLINQRDPTGSIAGMYILFYTL